MMRLYRIPKFTKWILSRFTDEMMVASIMEDLDYRFIRIRREKGLLTAYFHHGCQCVMIIFPLFVDNLLGGLAMFRSYLRVALRNLWRHKGYALINIIGLAVGVTVCILIFIFVEYELGFDSHFTHKGLLYRVVTNTHRPEGTEYTGSTPFPTAKALRSDFPELKLSTQFFRDADLMISVGKDSYKGNIAFFVESQFFDLFDTEWILGNTSHALDEPNTIILTDRVAKKYFGDVEAVGRILRLDNETDLHVTGVVADPPRRTSLPYDMLISWGTLDARMSCNLKQWDAIWGASQTYLRLPESIDPRTLEARFEAFEQKYMEPRYAEEWSFRLQPMKDIHFNPRYGSHNYVTSRTALFSFSAVGFVILLIACINFINLTTAQAMKRAKEVGLRKVLGADRAQLIRQLLGETSLFIIFSVLIALFIAWSVLPYLNQFLGNSIELRLFTGNGLVLFLGSVILFVSILNGLYPALELSRYRPAQALKERITSHRKRSYNLRNSLVLIQFIVSQILIVGTLVIVAQMKFMSRMDLGFRKEGMLTIPIPEYEESRCEALRSRWLQNPHIQDVSFAWSSPTAQSNFRTPFVYDESGDNTEYPVYIKMCDKRYLDIYEIPLVAGRFFERNAGDTCNKQWVVNEAVIGRMGLSDPEDAIGKRVSVNDTKGEIIGVISNFHVASLRSEIKPTVFFNYWPVNHREAQIKTNMKDVPMTVDYIKRVWTEYYPDYLFEYTFLDDFLEGLYETDAKLLTMIQSASFLAISIGCMGLLGLVSFMVIQRTKEIGIRKVLGATVRNVIFLVSKEFFRWVLIANILAWPVAYMLTMKWLQEFAYRIGLGVGYFLIGGLISLGIAALVVSYQVIRAATANPVEALRYE